MPKYKMKAPDGNTYTIDGPEGASDEEVREQILKQHPNAGTPATGGFLASIPRGLLGGLSRAGSALAQATAVEMGQPEMQETIPGAEQTRNILEREVTGPLPRPAGLGGRLGEAVGEVLGDPASYVGPGGLLGKVATGAASAVTGELAGEAAKEIDPRGRLEPWARFAGGLVGGVGVGLVGSEARLARLRGRLPTNQNIEDAATADYNFLKASDTRISEPGTRQLRDHVRTSLTTDNFTPRLADIVFDEIEALVPGGNVTVGAIDGVRRVLNKIKPTAPLSNYEASRRAIRAIDEWLGNVPDRLVVSGDAVRDAAVLRRAQGNWALHRQLDDVEAASTRADRAAARSSSAAARIQRTRAEIDRIINSEKTSRGLSPEVRGRMERIVLGTWLQNRTLWLSRFAPSDPLSAVASVVSGLGMGAAAGSVKGAITAAAVAAGGFIAQHLGEYLTDRQIAQLVQLMRAESPAGAPIMREISPLMTEQRMVPAGAAGRAAVTLAPGAQSPLGPQQ